MSPTQEEIGQLVPIGRIAKQTPYTARFLRQLAKDGQLKAFRFNRDWLTTPMAIRQYLKIQAGRHQKKAKVLEQAERSLQ